ncbi:MAG: nucleotidyltransferase domain-containing protein [Promethearchaeati archaeon SRVP18_Atabeyarchaeia-1]
MAERYPQYQLFFAPLQRKLVGLTLAQIAELRRPEAKLHSLLEGNRLDQDKLLVALREVLDTVTSHSKLRPSDFGVFGSVLHGFHHPEFSDLDFVVYGRRSTQVLRETLREIYSQPGLKMSNEFDEWRKWANGRHWYFKDIPLRDFCQYCRRKMVYAIYKPERLGRDFKIEFEPVRDWNEIEERYDPSSRIETLGRIRAVAEVLDDTDSFFMPSLYKIELKKVLKGMNVGPIRQITSFVEEFRGQAEAGEEVVVEGNLEKVTDSKGEYYQITLTRASNYYEQVLRPASSLDVS